MVEPAGAWLERTRRYLIVSGVLGALVWYPVLVPWAWSLAREGSLLVWSPWIASAGIALFLVGMSALWIAHYRRLDREIREWRARLARLKVEERAIIDELDG
jgi:hypothetical protein